MEKSKVYTCSHCGAAVTSEICPYCGSVTNVNTDDAYMDYPVLECKEAALGFWTTLFPLIFAVMFSMGGIMMLMVLLTGKADDGSEPFLILASIPFLGVGIAAAVIVLVKVIRFIILRSKGKHITGILYGYTNDNYLLNGHPAQVAKILVDTPKGKRFIMYQLGGTDKNIEVNSEVHLLVYKNIFMIVKNKEEVIDW